MGIVKTIDAENFPKQGNWVGKSVTVFFAKDFDKKLKGTILRHDHEEPFRVIIQLEDGRVILGSECLHEHPF